jgi:myo-inositol 2-dehydrogenase / D-chiro-inositol 1-dehydrogenase
VKIAVIGCGKQAPKHLEAFRQTPEISGLAVMDEDPARMHAMAAQFGAESRETLGKVFADRAIGAVVICTPTPTHAALVRRAIAAGKHVLCEKPLGASATVAPQIAAKAARAGLVARIGYIHRFAPAIGGGKRVVAALGPIIAAQFSIGAPGSLALWKHRRDQGGGATNELLSHMVDLALWYFGSVSACEVLHKEFLRRRRIIDGVEHAVDAEDVIAARLNFHSGVSAIVDADFLSPDFNQAIEIGGENGELRASIDPSAGSFYRLEAARNGFTAGTHRFQDAPIDLYRLQALSFVNAVLGREDSNNIACRLSEAEERAALINQLHAAPFTRRAAAG